MATILAATTGNWSAGGTWTGGVKPGAGDVAVANNKTVTIDEDVTCAELRNDTTGGATAGGGFSVPNTSFGTRNITAALVGGSAALVTCAHVTGNTVNVVGNVTGGTATSATGLQNSTTGAITVTGTVTGGSGSTTYGVNTVTGAATLTGDAVGGSAASAVGIRSQSTANLSINGHATGGVNATAVGVTTSSSGTITFTGGGVLTSGSAAPAASAIATGGIYGATRLVSVGGIFPVNGRIYLPNPPPAALTVDFQDADSNTRRYFSRAAFPDAAQILSGVSYQNGEATGTFDEAARNTDPGESNVLTGTSYKIQNVAKAGTFDEAARNTDPGESNVLTGTSYKIQSAAKTGTFDEAARNTDPGVGNVLAGTNYKIQNAAKAGTFDEAARNTDPGVANVLAGTNYTIQNAAKAGTFDEAARNTDPGESNVWNGTAYKIQNAAKTGTKRASSIANCTAENIKLDVVIDDVTGALEFSSTAPSAAEIRAALGLASANLDAQLDAILTGSGGGGATAQAVWEYASTLMPDNAETMLSGIAGRLAEQVEDGPVVVVPAPPDATQTAVWTRCWDEHGVPAADVEIHVQLLKTEAGSSGDAYSTVPVVGVSNEAGIATVFVPRGAGLKFQARRGSSGRWVKFDGADADALELPELLGN
jgi:hypothetical protein